ncbi:MAG: adenylate/guanylate cyclase domain-containing protein, partial [Actinomycetota bacterium]|nr:adenylate/guanylate cyclase domain-containing protein [Actinomycetota bacterium]
SSPAETQLAFRRLLEHEATERPLVVVFDDLHWAEPTFLDLVEHVSDLSRGTPIFLLCIARPELLDLRPTWGGGKMNATSILLEPLPAGDADQLVENLLEGAELDGPTRERILAAADGNPLFVEEMIAMVREDGDGAVAVPPTIQALLQARLDRLGDEERAVIERGAVEGEVFHQTAVMELASESSRADVPQRLLGLVRKELIRPSAPTVADDEAFRFRHLLIRDAAYDALPKATRADLHERFAVWLGEHANLLEQDEIAGYHLEQAAHYLRELGADHSKLAAAAAAHLARAARAAHGHGDLRASVNLRTRAVDLLPVGDPQRVDLLASLVLPSIGLGEFSAADSQIAELAAADEPASQAYALVFRSEIEMTRGELDDVERVRPSIDEAKKIFAELGDERGLSFAERALAGALWMECRADAASAAFARASTHAESAGDTALVNEAAEQMHGSAMFGPTPVEEAIADTERRIAGAADKPLVQARAKRVLARILALVGDFDRARTLMKESSETMHEAGLTVAAVAGYQARGFIERLAGDDEAAAEILREGTEELRRLGDHRYFSTTALSLALALVELGRIDEAEKWLEEAVAGTNPADVGDAAGSQAARGRIAALRGDHARGIEHVERAVELAERTDFYDLRTIAHVEHGKVLAVAGRPDEAWAAYEHALSITRVKGATAWTKQIEVLLGEL